MFRKLFGGKTSDSKIDDALLYFFEFSLFILDREGNGPFNLSEQEKYNFRQKYLIETGIEDYGVLFFSKIELESTSFTNYHLKEKTTFKIGSAWDTKNLSNPLVIEVRNHLGNIL